MKRITLIDLAIVFAVGSVMSPAGNAHEVPSHSSSTERIITFGATRHWRDADGRVLVCEFETRSNEVIECIDKKTGTDRWVPLEAHKIPGFEIAGIQYSFIGPSGAKILTVFYRPVRSTKN